MSIQTEDSIYAVRLMRLLILPMIQQAAYKLGIVDKEGKEIKKPTSQEEKDAYTPLHQLAFGMRQIIAKDAVIGNRLKQLSASMGLLRSRNIPQMYMEEFDTSILEDFVKFRKLVLENSLSLPVEEALIEEFLKNLEEDVPVNSTANISPGVPVIKRKKDAPVDPS
jgi:hypothetical protein